MTWIKFAAWLAVIYGLYYLTLIVWDLMRSGRTSPKTDEQILSFTEHMEVIKPASEPVAEVQGSATTASGGVNLKQLFSLCREEVVDYRKAVSY